MRDGFEKNRFVIETDVVEEHEMLMQLPHVADVGNHGHAGLPGHEADDQKLADPGHAHRIHLTDGHAAALEIVFEEDPVGHMFARGNADGSDGVGNGFVTEHIVGMGGLLQPEQIQTGAAAAEIDGLINRPLLIGIGHEGGLRSGGLADDAGAQDIAPGIGRADFEFHGGKSVGDGFGDVGGDLFVAVVEPADGGVVTGIAPVENALAPAAGGAGGVDQAAGLFAGEEIFDITEIEGAEECVGVEIQKELPERNPAAERPGVPAGVGDTGEGEVDHAFVRSQPAELLLVGGGVLPGSEFGHERFDVAAGQVAGEEVGGAADQIVAFAEGEGEAGGHGAVRQMEFGDRIGIHRIAVNGIAAGPGAQRETTVMGLDGENFHGSFLTTDGHGWTRIKREWGWGGMFIRG